MLALPPASGIYSALRVDGTLLSWTQGVEDFFNPKSKPVGNPIESTGFYLMEYGENVLQNSHKKNLKNAYPDSAG